MSKPAHRSSGIDLARGLAVLLMIQTHAYDGWIAPEHKASAGYKLSRVFASVPAPLFLLLAGVGLALGAQALQRRGAAPHVVRRSLLGRALKVVGYGYALSLVYSLIEGRLDPPTLLRADILHAIGLSLALCTVLLVGRGLVVVRGLGLVAGALAASLLAPHLVPLVPSVLRPLAALLLDVPPYTRFPLLPLCAFTAIGFLIGTRPLPAPRRSALWALGLVATVPLWQLLTGETVTRLGGTLSRAHPAIVWNVLEGTARALATLYAAIALDALFSSLRPPDLAPPRTEHWTVAWLLRLGRGSLLAYALHVPLCYGRLAAPLAGRLDMATATPLLLGLIALVAGCVFVRDQLASRLRPNPSPSTER